MNEELQKAGTGARKAWPAVMSWVGGITALIGLFGSLAGGGAWLVNHHRQQTQRQSKLALAQAQEKAGGVPGFHPNLRRPPQSRPPGSSRPRRATEYGHALD